MIRCSSTRRGETICSNTYRESAERLDNKVISAIEHSILTPERVAKVLHRALELSRERRKREPDNTAKLEATIKRLERERDRLIAACAEGRLKPESLGAEIDRRERELERLKADLAQSPHRLNYEAKDLADLRAAMLGRLERFRDLMADRTNIALARQALRTH